MGVSIERINAFCSIGVCSAAFPFPPGLLDQLKPIENPEWSQVQVPNETAEPQPAQALLATETTSGERRGEKTASQILWSLMGPEQQRNCTATGLRSDGEFASLNAGRMDVESGWPQRHRKGANHGIPWGIGAPN